MRTSQTISLPTPLTPFSILDLANVYRAAHAGAFGLQGILNQPRCGIDSKSGSWVSDCMDAFYEVANDCAKELQHRTPSSSAEFQQRADILLQVAGTHGDDLLESLKVVTALLGEQSATNFNDGGVS